MKLSSAEGGLSLSNSKGGGAIFSASGMGPGGVVSGSITISNSGGLPGAVTLSDSNLVNRPGTGGGLLSNRLQLLVTDDTERPLGKVLYMGKLGVLPDLPLGVFEPGQRRTYGFMIQFPEEPPAEGGDNAFADGSVEVSYVWSAVSVAGKPPVAPSVAPPAAPSPNGTSPAGEDRRAPLVRLRIRSVRRTLRRGYLVVLVRCDEWCTLRGRARWTIAQKRLPGSMRGRRAPAGRWTALKVYVPRRARGSLRAVMADHRRLSVRLALTVGDAAGNKRRVLRRIPLRM